MNATKYFTDGHSVRGDKGIYCVAHDVPAAGEICEILNSHADLVAALEAFVKACDSAPPLELMARISDACDDARAALAKARG